MSDYLMDLDKHTYTLGQGTEKNPLCVFVCNIAYCSEMMLFKGSQMANTVCWELANGDLSAGSSCVSYARWSDLICFLPLFSVFLLL